jgi:hypothetical protein
MVKRPNLAARLAFGLGQFVPDFVNFPVFFPVSREFRWRRVRIGLRRQPPSPVSISNFHMSKMFSIFRDVSA